MENDFLEFFDDLETDQNWPNVAEKNFSNEFLNSEIFDNKEEENSAFFSPFLAARPISLPPPPSPQPITVSPKKNSSKTFSLPFSFGSSKTKKQFDAAIKAQDLCSTTTKQIAKDVQLIAEEKAQIRQLPQPQMHGVANVSRNEEERRFLAQCDAASMEKKVLSLTKRKHGEEEQKKTQTQEKEDHIRKRGRKPKTIDVQKEFKNFECDKCLDILMSLRKNTNEFENRIPSDLKADVDLIRTTIQTAASFLCKEKEKLVASLFVELLPKLNHVLTFQFVMLFFSKHSKSRCHVETEEFPKFLLPFLSMIAGILSAETTVSTFTCNINLSDPIAYKQLPPSSRNGISFQDRLIWTIAVLSKQNLESFPPLAVLRVISLARYSQQVFKHAFRSLLIQKETELLENLLILATEDSLNLLVYLFCICEETKKNSINKIAANLCQKRDKLRSLEVILLGEKVDSHLMRHLLVYFYRNENANMIKVEKITKSKISGALIDVAELLIGENNAEQHFLFIEKLDNESFCDFFTKLVQQYDVLQAKEIFLSTSHHEIIDYKDAYENLMNLQIYNTAPMAFKFEKLHVQLPLPLRRNDSCIFFVTSTPKNGHIDLMHMLTNPAQFFATNFADIATVDFEIYISLFDEKEKKLTEPAWHNLSVLGCRSILDVVFCDFNHERENFVAKITSYEDPNIFAQKNSITTTQKQLDSKYIQVKNDDILLGKNPVTQFIDIDFLKSLVNQAFQAPKNVTANDFVEQYCRDRNYMLTKENY